MTKFDRIVRDFRNFEDVERLIAAFEELDEAAVPSWVPGLYRLLKRKGDFYLREAAARPIVRMEGLRALPQLLHALELGRREGHDNDGLAHDVTELVSMNAREAVPILLEMTHAASARERQDAAWLLGFVREEITPEPLLAAMADPDPDVRGAAVGALASFKDRPEVLEALTAALKDPEADVRVDAASSLNFFGDRGAIPALRAARKDADERVRFFVNYALERLE